MTSSARERSYEGGVPVQYFRFTRGSVKWCLTNADRALELLGDTYQPAAISRDSSIRMGSESSAQSIKVSLPADLEVATNWRPFPPSEAISLTIFVQHHGETDALVEWIGRIVSPKFTGAKLTLTGEPSRTYAKRNGAPRTWSPACGLVLYSLGHDQCNLNPEISTFTGTVTESAELTLSVSSAAFANTGRSLSGGRLAWAVDDESFEAVIATHSVGANTLTLQAGSDVPSVGAAISAYTKPLYLTGALTAVSGLTLTASAFSALPSGRLAGGFVRWERADGLIEFRTIRAHSGSSITLDYGALDLATGLEVRAYPGCAHTWADCGYHANQNNYGGDLWMPTKNPFDGNPVW